MVINTTAAAHASVEISGQAPLPSPLYAGRQADAVLPTRHHLSHEGALTNNWLNHS